MLWFLALILRWIIKGETLNVYTNPLLTFPQLSSNLNASCLCDDLKYRNELSTLYLRPVISIKLYGFFAHSLNLTSMRPRITSLLQVRLKKTNMRLMQQKLIDKQVQRDHSDGNDLTKCGSKTRLKVFPHAVTIHTDSN